MSVTQEVGATWFTAGLSLPVSLGASWCSEEAALLVQQGEVLPASWRLGCAKAGQRGWGSE